MSIAASDMTRRERDDLAKLIRQRAKVEKAGLTQRRAEMMAEFERQISAIYHWDDDAVWAEANAAAEKAVKDARAVIAERCRNLGIPQEFAPTIGFAWYGRGENAVGQRRTELRRSAKARVDAMEAAAKTEIERASVDAQTRMTLQEELTRIWEAKRATVLFVTHDVDEAVFLANRVVVLSARPATVREVVDIALPRPRSWTALVEDPAYKRLVARVLSLVRTPVV